MAENNLISKLVWLADVVQRSGEKGITFEEINERWTSDNNTELSGGAVMPKRTFHKWLNMIHDTFKMTITCQRRGGYHYIVEDFDGFRRGSVRKWLLDTVSVSNLLMQNTGLKDRILLEDVPSGQEYLPLILEAMQKNNVITITHQSFKKDEPSTNDVHPYCVKMFERRWYLVAYNMKCEMILIYALDRIHDVTVKKETFNMPKDFDPAEYFRHYYGITTSDNNEPPDIVKLRVNIDQAKFLRSLPLHQSQSEKADENDANHVVFSYYLCPNIEFTMKLLSMGASIEVLKPKSLRDEIAHASKKMYEMYHQQK